MANDINQPKDFSWAGLAATTGIAGLGGFIFDRYIRGNKNLMQNLGMAAGFGAGGALASTAYQIISDKARVAANEKLREQGKQISQAGVIQDIDPKTGKVIEKPTPIRRAEDWANRSWKVQTLGRTPEMLAAGDIVRNTIKGVREWSAQKLIDRDAAEKIVKALAEKHEKTPADVIISPADASTLRWGNLDPNKVAKAVDMRSAIVSADKLPKELLKKVPVTTGRVVDPRLNLSTKDRILNTLFGAKSSDAKAAATSAAKEGAKGAATAAKTSGRSVFGPFKGLLKPRNLADLAIIYGNEAVLQAAKEHKFSNFFDKK